MSISISDIYPVSPVATSQDTTNAAPQAEHAAPSETDTVELSESAQVHALQQSGEGVSEIANTLGLSVSSVDSLLGIVEPQAAAPTVAPSGTSAASTPLA